jgi:type I restriction enzyme M protein
MTNNILQEILKGTQYSLEQFKKEDSEALINNVTLKPLKDGSNKYYIQCLKREKEILLTPEEVVRQLFLLRLTDHYRYPLDRIAIEYPIKMGSSDTKRADIVIFDKDRPTIPYIIIELKHPKLKDGKEQLKSYCHATGSPMGVWSNGEQISYYHRINPNYFENISDIPNANQTLAEIKNEKFTIADLIKIDKLVHQKKSLKNLIEEMEDEVLANAGVDVFEEMFKLIFAKLYDEFLCGTYKDRHLEFRNTGQTEKELKDKIEKLLSQAIDKWQGVFAPNTKINLSLSHLAICVSSLQDVKLFNSNLDVVDDAFEHLMNKSSKGEKGQFFTARYVIDMCVKMMNPKKEEYVIDTACGSAGFTMHTIFHVWQQILKEKNIDISNLHTIEQKPQECMDYVKEKVFAIDFDEKAIRVARCLNLIAGDGQTNCLHLNTLDYKRWDETRTESWVDSYNEGYKRFKKLNKDKDGKSFVEFEFDVLLANPPFAGDIKEGNIIHHYDIAKKNGKFKSKVGRDILFIERNLDFLKPGGRMAVVLPQGRFNNSTDKYIRDYIAERCRILAVVGLHANVFKSHTGTKTSVLFVQKWDDKLCPKLEDYNIFFATMQKPSKDNSGEKIYVKDTDGTDKLDNHGHKIVDHDLYNHDGLTQDGIAEAFVEFAKKEGLSFVGKL